MRWAAKVKSAQGALVEVSIDAPHCAVALALFRQLYGEKNVIIGPWQTAPSCN
jgi:hypothetical protein